MSAGAQQRLMSELKGLEKEKWVNIELDNGSLFKWNVGLIVVNSESAFDGAYFKAQMVFTDKYPFEPPSFRFLQPIYHPNIYADGKLCISILHTPGEDAQSGELASERWSPLQGAESVLRSILLLLDDPEISSPANVDAGVMYRDKRAEYNEKAAETVVASKKNIPDGFIMPTSLETAPPKEIPDDEDFWAQSEEENDFGASDSDEDFDMDEDEEEGEGEDEEESED
ncbi:Ubiquitin-conjugating enzyme E2-34 kDa [Lachnellula suecica]|uniref:Ubiquitin-conjugating enzyme E2 2 n=1 Tax=Lachnellula suecica TaxID=602035 RepID=A0A8T9CF82_9HELO|nr:Ubiquitin-conjugating enzyme E2-34 kDa [Lachnellula suecica]